MNIGEIFVSSLWSIQPGNNLKQEQHIWRCNQESRSPCHRYFDSTIEDVIKTDKTHCHSTSGPSQSPGHPKDRTCGKNIDPALLWALPPLLVGRVPSPARGHQSGFQAFQAVEVQGDGYIDVFRKPQVVWHERPVGHSTYDHEVCTEVSGYLPQIDKVLDLIWSQPIHGARNSLRRVSAASWARGSGSDISSA